MESYISTIEKDIELKYLLALRKKTFIDGLVNQQEKLENLIKELKEINLNINNNNSSDNVSDTETPKENLEAINQFIYNKPWNKLAPIHKILKIKEYINKSLSIHNEESKKKLINELTDAIKNKKINKKEHVNYDESKAMIVSIPLLKHKDGNYYLQFE